MFFQQILSTLCWFLCEIPKFFDIVCESGLMVNRRNRFVVVQPWKLSGPENIHGPRVVSWHLTQASHTQEREVMFTPKHKVNTVSKAHPDTTLELEEAATYHQSIAGMPLSELPRNSCYVSAYGGVRYNAHSRVLHPKPIHSSYWNRSVFWRKEAVHQS